MFRTCEFMSARSLRLCFAAVNVLVVDLGPSSARKLARMSQRTSVLGILRRRRAGVGRFVLAWFVLASASASAAPCFAMALSSTPAASAAASTHHDNGAAHAMTGHDHAHAVTHDHSAAHDHSPAHVHSAAHDHSPRSEPANPSPSHGPTSPCMHCPLSVAMVAGSTNSHAFCSAADDVAESGKSSAPPLAFKAILSPLIVVLVPVECGPGLPGGKQVQSNAAATSVRLNLRHCVFLI